MYDWMNQGTTTFKSNTFSFEFVQSVASNSLHKKNEAQTCNIQFPSYVHSPNLPLLSNSLHLLDLKHTSTNICAETQFLFLVAVVMGNTLLDKQKSGFIIPTFYNVFMNYRNA